MKYKISKWAVVNALAATVYIAAIASFIFYAPKFFGPTKGDNTVFIPIVMLLLLVFSVALMAILIFGRPVILYLDGNKKEALSLLFQTLGVLFFAAIIALIALYFLG